MIVFYLLIIGLLSIAFALRIVPHYLSPAGAGVDHWFWKVYIETYRKKRVFPPVLPRYVFDQHQWYPPLFPLLMAKLPAWLFDRYSHVISIAADLIRMLLLLFLLSWQSSGDPLIIAFGGLIYAMTPIQVFYNIQLNPRVFAAIFLDLVLMLLLWYFGYNGPWWVWFFVLFLSGLILLTHKMTTQIFWFIAIGWSLIYRDWRPIMLVPASITVAMLMSKGFYWKVLLAHWDIVSFWSRNWEWIGADPIRESPIYGDGKYERPEKLHGTGVRGIFVRWGRLLGFNPAAWFACLLVYERLFIRSPLLLYPTPILVWLLLICLFAVITTFIKPFKCLGAGNLYIYNTSLISSLLIALTYKYTYMPEIFRPFAITLLAVNMIGVFIYYKAFIKNKRWRIDYHLDNILKRLKDLPEGVVMCVPYSWHEPVAYKTHHAVLYGAHGYGFKLIEPFFPRLKINVKELFKRYNVTYLVTRKDELPENFLADLPAHTIISENSYQIYCFTNKKLDIFSLS